MAAATARRTSDACIVAWPLSLEHCRTLQAVQPGQHIKLPKETAVARCAGRDIWGSGPGAHGGNGVVLTSIGGLSTRLVRAETLSVQYLFKFSPHANTT